MTDNTYDEGRLNLPFVGICTFGKYPYIEDWDNINADVAVMGARFHLDMQAHMILKTILLIYHQKLLKL